MLRSKPKAKKLLVGLLLLVVFFLTHRFFFCSGDFDTHDAVHFIRLYDLEKVLGEGQFPPRWLPDLGKGYGYPLFNFYPPLAYWAGLFFRLFGFSFTMANKLSFALGGLAGLGGMFFLASYLFGFWGGAIATLFWLLLPYRAVDLYVRGALAEYWGMNLLPWLFYFTKRYFDQTSLKRFLPLALITFLLLLAHNATALIGLIWLAVFIVFLLLTRRNKKEKLVSQLLKLAAPYLLGLLMAAFFIFPAILEKNLTHIADMTSDYFAYYNHFPSLYQLFISPLWGYGGSGYGLGDDMSFQIGYFHWVVVAISALVGLYFLIRKKKAVLTDKKILLAGFFVVSFLAFLFLTHQRSLFIWQKVNFLAFLQFPWRLLLFIGLSTSILAGFLVGQLKLKTRAWILAFSSLALLGLNFNYFQPQEVLPRDDEDYLSTDVWQHQQLEFLTDYLPSSVAQIPEDYYSPPLIEAQDSNLVILLDQADKLVLAAESGGEEITIKRFYFPGWQAKINNNKAEVGYNDNGFMVLRLPSGTSQVELFFTDTPIRRAANIISLLGIGVFIILLIEERWPFLKRK